ncbi:MAG TPA: extracellular solute-binding protein [Myxococcota bacterium]|nr:extracellular solute-binding protein [Myxococcota bacterium]
MIWALLGLVEAAEIHVWHSYRGGEREGFEQALEAWDADHPELDVIPLAVPNESFANKLEAASPRGNGPDLFVYAQERIGDWSAKGLIVPLQGPVSPDWHPKTVEALRWQDEVWGVPMASKVLVLFYDPAIGEPPATTDELLEVAARWSGDGRFGLAYESSSPYFNAAWLHGHGGGVLSEGGIALDSPENVAAMTFVSELVDSGVVPEEPTGAIVTDLFNQGSASMVINGPWFLGEIDEDVDFAVTTLPIVSSTGLPAAPYLTVEAAFVSAYAEQPEAARELARYLATPEAARVRAEVGRQVVATGIELDDPVLEAFARQLDNSVPMPIVEEMSATWEPMARAYRRVLRGSMEPGPALEKAAWELAIVTRPPPETTDWRPYAVGLGLVVLGLLAWSSRSAWRARRAIVAWKHAYAYVAPAALAMSLLVVLPFLVGAGVSFFAHHQGEFTFVGLAHYVDIVLARDWPVTSPQSFWYTLVVTVLWTVSNVALHVTLGVALAMLLREKWVRMRGVFRVLLILPWAIPNYITALIWKMMFHTQFGAINGLLSLGGVEPVSWFGSFSAAFAANLATNTWLGFPFMMVVTLGALQSIPRDLEAAAEVDGASAWQRFRHITLPLLRPALLPAVILGSVWTFNMFNIIYLVSGGEPDGGTEILISEAYRWAFTRQHQYGYAAAYAVLIFGVLILYSRWTNRVAGQKVL